MKLALGTVQFGLDYGVSNDSGQVSTGEAAEILKCAKSLNIDTLDTSANYGTSEKVLGEIGVEGCQIVTKTMPLERGVDAVIDGLQQSLDRLNATSIKGLLIHNIEEINRQNFDTLYQELVKLKEQGLIAQLGFSTYTPEQVDVLLESFEFDLIQVPFNVFDARLIKGGQLEKLKQQGIEVHARSVFLQGLLLMNRENRPKKFKRWDALWRLWEEWLADHHMTALEAAIRYAVSVPELSKVLVGVNTASQLEEIVYSSSGISPKVPVELLTEDVNLLNPSNWSNLE